MAAERFLIAYGTEPICTLFEHKLMNLIDTDKGLLTPDNCRTSLTAHKAAMRRIEIGGGVPVTAIQILLEFQRDWARKEKYNSVTDIVKEHGGAYGQGVEYASTLVHGSSASPRAAGVLR